MITHISEVFDLQNLFATHLEVIDRGCFRSQNSTEIISEQIPFFLTYMPYVVLYFTPCFGLPLFKMADLRSRERWSYQARGSSNSEVGANEGLREEVKLLNTTSIKQANFLS